MPRNGNGGYSPPPNSWNPAVNGSTATPADWDELRDDIADAIAASVAADGQTPMTGHLRMSSRRVTGLGAPTSNGDALRREQLSRGSDISSASTIEIPVEGSLFAVTGSTNISAITGSFPGRTVTLRFDDDLQLINSAALKCPKDRDLSVTAGQMVIAICLSANVWAIFTGAGSGYSFEIGDFLDTARNPGSDWLRRNGLLYLRATYPNLAALLPPLPDGFTVDTIPLPARPYANNRVLRYFDDSFHFINGTQSNEDPKLRFYSSEFGVDWEEISPDVAAIAYAIDGKTGLYGLLDITESNLKVWRSTDGGQTWLSTAWTLTGTVHALAYYPEEDVFLIGGPSGSAYKTADLINFTQIYPNLGAPPTQGFAVGDGKVVAWGGSSLSSSEDGDNWTLRTIGIGVVSSVAFANGKWVAVGWNGGITVSDNLSSWFPKSSGVTTSISEVVGNEDGFIALTTGRLLLSEDGDNWTQWVFPPGFPPLGGMTLDPNNPRRLLFLSGDSIFELIRTSPNEFRVPNDNPSYGWIKAL